MTDDDGAEPSLSSCTRPNNLLVVRLGCNATPDRFLKRLSRTTMSGTTNGPASILGGVLGFVGGVGSARNGADSAQARELSRHVMGLLADEDVQLLTTLDLNRLATYTYHVDSFGNSDNDLLETMVLTLQSVLSKPAAHSTNTLLKGLAVTEWLITYGSDRVVMEAKVLGRNVEMLQQYNTVLLAQQSSGASALLMRIKGGGVDLGGPVRAKADKVMRLLSDPSFYAQERANKSDPGSLVPVGSAKKVGFVTDEVRLHILRRRVEEEIAAQTRLKSNLQKPEGGFGSGYSSKDGKSVVGAAHGIDEMIKMAQREKDRFVDGASQPGMPVVNDRGDILPGFAVGGGGGGTAAAADSTSSFSEYRAPTLVDYAPHDTSYAPTTYPSSHNEVDLLDFNDHHASGGPTSGSAMPAHAAPSFDEDLLGMSSSSSVAPAAAAMAAPHSYAATGDHGHLLDLVTPPSTSSDCIMAAASTTSSMSTVVTSNDFLGFSNSSIGCPAVATSSSIAAPRDPFAAVQSSAPAAPTSMLSMGGATAAGLHGLLGSLSLSTKSSSQFTTPSIDVTPKLPSATMMAYPSTGTATTLNNGGAFDRFAALDVLAGTAAAVPPSALSTGPAHAYAATGGSAVGWSHPAANPAGINATSTGLAPATLPPSWSSNHHRVGGDGSAGDNGFVMGGSSGAGLFPLGPAPAAPPPPPPPSGGASTFSFY
jgi:ENTH domain